jgi:hypothetical protein
MHSIVRLVRGALLTIALFSSTSAALAQGAPINGTAQLKLTPSAASVAAGSNVQVTVTVDLTPVTGTGPGGTTPAVLGAYDISVDFDKTKLQFVSAAGGTSSQFSGPPTATSPAIANPAGSVTINAAQAFSSTAPTGSVNVAVLTFTATANGSASMTAYTDSAHPGSSLASALQGSFGPTSIPGASGSASVSVVTLPGAASNPSPADGAGVSPGTVALNWTAGSGATSYQVFFGTGAAPPLVDTTSSTTSNVPVAAGTTYYWRVVSINGAGSTPGPLWSFTASGTLCVTPTAPVLSPPSSALSGTTYAIIWQAVPGASEYRVEESTESAFLSPTVLTISAPATQATFTHSAAQTTTFYYRVLAKNTSSACPATSGYSAVLTVAVQPLPILSRIIPVVGSTPGVAGSHFRTAAQLYNSGTTPISGTIIFHPTGVSAAPSDPSIQYSLDARKSLAYTDIVESMGQSGLGSLEVRTTGRFPVMFFRIFNDGGVAGSTGMVIDPLRTEDALVTGQSTVLFAPADTLALRMNIGVRTLSNGATLALTVQNRDGAVVRTLTKQPMPANYFAQVTDAAFIESSASLSAGDTLTISVTSGEAMIYAAITDNKTQDPTLQRATPLP